MKTTRDVELESDLQETLWTGAESDLLILMLEKLNLFCLTNLVLLIRKLMGLSIQKNHLLRCWGCLFLKNLIGAITLSLLLKLPPRKLDP